MPYVEARIERPKEPYYHSNCAYDSSLEREWFKKKVGKEIKKDSARNYALNMGKGMPVISHQLPGEMGRNFLVTSWDSFLKNVEKKFDSKSRSFYENIYLGEPCRLYVDVETSKKSEGPFLVESIGETREKTKTKTEHYYERERRVLRFAEALSDAIDYFYGNEDVKITSFYVLDSSSENRFSQHLIFHINEDRVKFKCSADLKAFFEFVSTCSELCKTEEHSPFYWPTNLTEIDSTMIYMSDMSVYGNKSREFRVIGSTKRGQERYMVARALYTKRKSGDCKKSIFVKENLGKSKKTLVDPTYDPRFDDADNAKHFLDSLVCHVRDGETVEAFLTFSLAKREFKKAAFPSSEVSGYLKTDRDVIASGSDSASVGGEFLLKKMEKNDASSLRGTLFEECENFKRFYYDCRERVIEAVANDIVSQNFVALSDETLEFATCVETENSFHVTYKTSSKYCTVKNDYHGNNHVYYVAELNSKIFYQRCWNATCCEKASSTMFASTRAPTVDVPKNDEEKADALYATFSSRLSKSSAPSCRSGIQLLNSNVWKIINAFLRMTTIMEKKYESFAIKVNEIENDRRVTDMIEFILSKKFERFEIEEEGRRGESENEKKIAGRKKPYEDSDEELLNFLF